LRTTQEIIMRSTLALFTAAAAFAAAPAHAATPNMNDRLWEIAVQMNMPGMPSNMPPQTVKQCITGKDLEDPRKTMPGGDPKDNRCQVSDYKMQGSTATWKMACKGPEEMTGSGSMTYGGSSYKGTNTMTVKQGGQARTMTMNYAGKYLGPCPSR
jgi:Protein of unknown function (DUF3617)